ncbi:class I SAM-dependent methyltransferase [bacterium]|nr:class I SAM-dependent methyltransferase [bacterium]
MRRIHAGELAACINLLENCPLSGKILDMGCGDGALWSALSHCQDIIGVDFSVKMFNSLRQSNLMHVCAAVLEMPFPDAGCDCITAIGISEYIDDEGKILSEMHRLLKPEGYVLYTLSPPSIWTVLRRLLGHRIYARHPRDTITLAESLGFKLIDQKETLMQVQLLFRI